MTRDLNEKKKKSQQRSGESIPGSGNIKCKGPGAGESLVCVYREQIEREWMKEKKTRMKVNQRPYARKACKHSKDFVFYSGYHGKPLEDFELCLIYF